MDIWIKAAQLILSLSILVILHELGHYIPAKLFKTRVEKFYLFFDPWFSIFKKKIGDTEWGIGWLPLGGYVKISGMVDESMDKEQLAQPAQPWEFRSKKAWQRLIIMLGGVTVNLILGIFIYIMIVFAYGEEKLNPKDLKAGIAAHPYLKKYGVESGDNILKINGESIDNVLEYDKRVMFRGGRTLEVLKADGSKKTVQLPEKIEYELFEKGALPCFSPRVFGVEVGEVDKESPVGKLDLKKGDKIVTINAKQIVYYDEFQKEVFNSKGKEVSFQIQRGSKIIDQKVKIPTSGKYEGRFGFTSGGGKIVDDKAIKQMNYSFGESIGNGLDKGLNTLGDYASQLKFLFTKKGATSIGGFVSMGKMLPSTWDWQAFWAFTAFLSIALALMNILPIPGLDGGHIVFLLYEMVTGKEAPQKVLEYAQYAGIVLLLGLMLYANGNDIYKLIFG
ncbi:MAG: RIP metalloprotease RseP [Flavobacteriia bacterium]|jgi:regulator of sigma E protease